MIKLEPKGEGSFGGYIYEHPSFGHISFSRVTHNQARLFGSHLLHTHSIQLEISGAEVQTSRHGENYTFAKNSIIRVLLSPDQYVQAITNMNTSGVPCTIEHVQGKQAGDVPELESLADMSRENLTKRMEVLVDRFKAQETRIKDLVAKGRAGKGELEKIMEDVSFMRQELTRNVPFFLSQFERGMGVVVREAKANVESFISMKIHDAGVAAIQEKGGIELPTPDYPALEEGSATEISE